MSQEIQFLSMRFKKTTKEKEKEKFEEIEFHFDQSPSFLRINGVTLSVKCRSDLWFVGNALAFMIALWVSEIVNFLKTQLFYD